MPFNIFYVITIMGILPCSWCLGSRSNAGNLVQNNKSLPAVSHLSGNNMLEFDIYLQQPFLDTSSMKHHGTKFLPEGQFYARHSQPSKKRKRSIGALTNSNQVPFSSPGEKDDFVMCPSKNSIERYTNNRQPAKFPLNRQLKDVNIEQMNIKIGSRFQCTQKNHIVVNGTLRLNVEVKNCCITDCTHEITIDTNDDLHYFLNFTIFNVPGRNLISNSNEKVCHESLSIIAVTSSGRTQNVGMFCGVRKPTIVYLDQSTFKLVLSLRENHECIDKFQYELLIAPCKPFVHESCDTSVDIITQDSSTGSLSTPGLSHSMHYPNDLNCRWIIAAPNDKLIQVTPLELDIGKGDVLTITVDELFTNTFIQFPKVLKFTEHEPMRNPIVLPSYKCTIEFASDEIVTSDGLKLQYTAVDKSGFIPMNDYQQLICSEVQNMPHYLSCDYIPDCVDYEDEKGCAYINPDCESGIIFENSCYRFWVERSDSVSWIKAEEYCAKLDGHLISFNTKAEKNFFEYKLRKKYGIQTMFLGLQRMKQRQVPQMYRRLWRWVDGRTAFYLPAEFRFESWQFCSLLTSLSVFRATDCDDQKTNITVLCETQMTDITIETRSSNTMRTHNWTSKLETFQCQSGELISLDQRCDNEPVCFDKSDEENCDIEYSNSKSIRVDKFDCGNKLLSYSFVCNGINECSNKKDEDFCTYRTNKMKDDDVSCTSGMKIKKTSWCDGIEDCIDSSDEDYCETCQGDSSLCPGFYCMSNKWIDDGEIDCPIRDPMGQRVLEKTFEENTHEITPPPGVVEPDTFGKISIRALNADEQCESTHFQCRDGYCIPVYMLCNGILDCPFGEDENTQQCMGACQGLYKCRGSMICIHFEQVCDGKYNCPLRDDEFICSYTYKGCPEGCRCSQSEYDCDEKAIGRINEVEVHKLTMVNSLMKKMEQLKPDKFRLIYLNVSHNMIHNVNNSNLDYPNLLVLDLAVNSIQLLAPTAFEKCPRLKTLNLGFNDLQFFDLQFLKPLTSLVHLNLEINYMSEIKDNMFENSVGITHLDLKSMGITIIRNDAFTRLKFLKVLDLRGNNIIIYTDQIFKSASPSYLDAENYQLCCPSMTPANRRITTCNAPSDEISSCDDMLGSAFLRVSLWMMAILTIFGNIGVIIQRIFRDESRRITFRIIIICLAISDLLMGFFLVIIGTADLVYKDIFLFSQKEWKESIACQTAGFLCVLSSESSALFILLATLDRVIAIALPLRQNLQLTHRSTGIISIFIWIIGISIASIPLIPPFDDWKLYSQLAVGVPLPITRKLFNGFDFAFAIFIVLNMVIFFFVVVGQIVIWVSIKKRSGLLKTEARAKQDMAIAQRLFLVVVTDCFCWFPISLMGILAKLGVAIPGAMYVIASVYLLPANSALNPFLYTLNSLLMKRREMKQYKTDSEVTVKSSTVD